jgi:hypothetical protein
MLCAGVKEDLLDRLTAIVRFNWDVLVFVCVTLVTHESLPILQPHYGCRVCASAFDAFHDL